MKAEPAVACGLSIYQIVFMRLLSLVLLLTTFASCTSDERSTPPPSTRDIPFRADGTLAFVRGGEVYREVAIEVAATDSARERGLMERAPLTDDQGMLFLFDYGAQQSFWMASTPSSLDIIFVAPDSTVVNVVPYTRPFSTDQVSSTGIAQYVLEVPAGFADRYAVAPGDTLRWQLD